MGYERNDRRFGGGYGDDRGRDYYGRDRDTESGRYAGAGGYPRASYDRGEQGRGTYPDYRGNRFDDRSDRLSRDHGRDTWTRDDERGFFDRAGDEVRSWFGDEDAERRRRADEARRASYEGGYDDQDRGRFGGYGPTQGRGESNRDPGYHSWRDRQIQQFDHDYDEYRQEHQRKFDSEFHSWRQGRQGQRDLLGKVQEHQEVVGSDGQHIGTVDHVRGDRIKLTKTDKDARGHHHSIPSSWLQSVEEKITIGKTAEQAKAHWRDEDRNTGGLFGAADDDRDAWRARSFTGIY